MAGPQDTPDKYAYLDALTKNELQAFKGRAAGLDMRASDEIARMAAAPRPAPDIVAEGDSWFDYLPGTDLIDCLRNLHGRAIKNFAEAGDTLENMIYGTEYGSSFAAKACQFQMVLDTIEELQAKVFLFSGGGNDIAGDEFGTYLNHAASGRPLLRQDVVASMFGYFESLLQYLIDRVKAVSPKTRIVMHGYAPPIPTGQGVQWLMFKFAGPWLRPALTAKRILDLNMGRRIVAELIDRYNELLAGLATKNPGRFFHADVRQLVDPARDWANELHLTNSAYARVADAINALI